ncbi:MAG TPA: hypothetical protein VN711_04855 [Candidatus Saccharimonadales bacterium]|nr:hypothetical protein [Candidatus Saccharimonadales bacterium]
MAEHQETFAEIFQESPLWELEIEEIIGRNIESKGRDSVNGLLKQGWILLHIYTLRYKEDDMWRERPMAILGRPHQIMPLQQPH